MLFSYHPPQASLDYHTSAVLATALDTLTAPYRLQASAVTMAHVADALTFSGRKVPWLDLPLVFLANLSLPESERLWLEIASVLTLPL